MAEGRSRRLNDWRAGRVVVSVALVLAGGLGACADGRGDDRVLVLAASSLTEAFEALEAVVEADGLDVEYSFAASPTLLAQVEQGAPADVIAVADPALLGAGTESFVFAHNHVVAIVPAASDLAVLDDLGGAGVRVVVATDDVPIGRYAREALRALGLLEAVMANVVSEEADAKSVLAKVALGEADAGVVYATDARAEGRVRVLGEPLPVEAAYAAAVADDAPHPAEAQRFVALLASQDARRTLERFGYRTP